MDRPLSAHVADVIAELPEVRSGPGTGAASESAAGSGPGISTWSRGGREFAALGSGGIEIRLDSPIAAAAARTPDVAPSQRGAEWIRFSPREMDAHALDRLRAWLELAYRRAGE